MTWWQIFVRIERWRLGTWLASTLLAMSYVLTTFAEAPAQDWVDERSCQGCHKGQYDDWSGSHHQLAMQPANEQTVQGDFSDYTFQRAEGSVRFYRRAGEFWVRTPGIDGRPGDFRVAYTFGVEPLQQYLLQLPKGRLQAFDIAWDTRQQKWFALQSRQSLGAEDPLYWMGLNQNANFMCIDCHTTGFKRNYDAQSDSYSSHWQALGVGCQSCHGPAGAHLRWASGDAPQATSDPFAEGLRREAQVEVCARCHSRRAMLADGYTHTQRLMDDYLPAVLTPILNEIDGKIREEVFEYGSFLQSRMHAAGVVCSDCHEPHSGTLRANGNALCAQCHNSKAQPSRALVEGTGLQAKDYDSTLHHGHEPGTAAAQCVSCHMPGRYFMIKDRRHDHSFSVPSPVQAMRLGHSDACLGCHADMPAERLLASFQRLFDNPQPRDGGYALALHDARGGRPGALLGLLEQLQRTDLPAIRRATLLAELSRYPSARAARASQQATKHQDPQVREMAVSTLTALLPVERQTEALAPLLLDPVRAVRIAAAWALAQLPRQDTAEPEGFAEAIDEYEQVQQVLRERPEANLNLAMLYQARGPQHQVEPALREALRRDGHFDPARIALAQLLESRGLAQEGCDLLQAGLRQGESAALQYAIAMSRLRQSQPVRALAALRRAYELESDHGEYRYAYALGLYESGQREQAVELLEQGLVDDPSNRMIRQALLAYARKAGDQAKVVRLREELRVINPDDPLVQ